MFSKPNNQTLRWNLTIYDNSAKPQQITDSKSSGAKLWACVAKQRLHFIKHILCTMYARVIEPNCHTNLPLMVSCAGGGPMCCWWPYSWMTLTTTSSDLQKQNKRKSILSVIRTSKRLFKNCTQSIFLKTKRAHLSCWQMSTAWDPVVKTTVFSHLEQNIRQT